MQKRLSEKERLSEATHVYGLYITFVWLHLTAAAVWVGGMVFFAAVIVPVLRHPDYRASAGDLVHRTGVRFRVLGWVALGTLIATGTYLLVHRGVGLTELTSPDFYATSFGRTITAKLLVVLAIVVATLVHDLSMGPRATRLLRESPTDPRAQRIRVVARWWGRANLLLALVVLVLAAMLVRGAPW